jgi:hypothetical protein
LEKYGGDSWYLICREKGMDTTNYHSFFERLIGSESREKAE